jgi:hypothetical protein
MLFHITVATAGMGHLFQNRYKSIYERLQHAVSYVEKTCEQENVSIKALKSGGRRRKITIVRSQLAKELVEK